MGKSNGPLLVFFFTTLIGFYQDVQITLNSVPLIKIAFNWDFGNIIYFFNHTIDYFNNKGGSIRAEKEKVDTALQFRYDLPEMNDIFIKLPSKITLVTGSPIAFITALIRDFSLGNMGPIFHFSDTWQPAY